MQGVTKKLRMSHAVMFHTLALWNITGMEWNGMDYRQKLAAVGTPSASAKFSLKDFEENVILCEHDVA